MMPLPTRPTVRFLTMGLRLWSQAFSLTWLLHLKGRAEKAFRQRKISSTRKFSSPVIVSKNRSDKARKAQLHLQLIVERSFICLKTPTSRRFYMSYHTSLAVTSIRYPHLSSKNGQA